MLNLKKIAVTGGIAAGKSTVCFFFKAHGAYIVDADSIVHELYSQTNLGKQVIQLLGKDILENNEISREKIAKKVFEQPEKLYALEKLVHPYVYQEIHELYENVRNQKNHSLFVVEIPLLFETGKDPEFDYVITVLADNDLCKTRYEERVGGKQDYDKRIQRLMPMEEKMAKSDFIIINNGSLEELREQVSQIVKKLTQNNKPY